MIGAVTKLSVVWLKKSLEAIKGGRVKNVRGYLWIAMLKQARIEYALKMHKLGHVRRKKHERMNMTDLEEPRQQVTDETQESEAA